MDKFIYVFCESARDKLLSRGYKLLKSDDRNRAYIFENTPNMNFALDDISYITDNTLTF